MNSMRIALLGLTLVLNSIASAEPASTVHLSIENDAIEGKIVQDRFAIEAHQPLMGEALPNRIEISVGEGPANSVRATPVTGSFSLAQQPESSSGVLVIVGAKLQPEKGIADQQHFKSLEKPVIEKHQGEVLISLATQPSPQWPFDIVELVSFPSLEHYQSLMNDPAYAPDTPMGQAMMTTYTQDLNVAVATLK
jgi:uncharacterized protein (DUF1330 family)